MVGFAKGVRVRIKVRLCCRCRQPVGPKNPGAKLCSPCFVRQEGGAWDDRLNGLMAARTRLSTLESIPGAHESSQDDGYVDRRYGVLLDAYDEHGFLPREFPEVRSTALLASPKRPRVRIRADKKRRPV